jgi:hypothetical protein
MTNLRYSLALVFFLSVNVFIASAAEAKNKTKDIGLFTVQFYRLKIDKEVIVQNIYIKDHFFTVEGTTTSKSSLLHLSRKLLKSEMLSSFRIIDSLIKFDKKRFRLYLKTKNSHLNKKLPWVSLDPISYRKLKSSKVLSGECYPNTRRVVIKGDVNSFSLCRKGKWSLKLKRVPNHRRHLYIFTQIANNRGITYFDGVSLINTHN